MSNHFIMLVGLPGSGKSYWANENFIEQGFNIYSSDAYRLKLLGNYQDQSNNKLVFDALYKDLIADLKFGEDVCLDATNICRKDRAHILSILPEDCTKVAMVFAPSISTVLQQNKNRQYPVPESVIRKMLCRFEIPLYGEGFDIILMQNVEKVYKYEDFFFLL